jgi:hypothetical protein
MQIIKRKDYIEINIPYDEIEEYKDMIEFLEFKKAVSEINVPPEIANEILEEINEDLRKRAKETLKRIGIEVDN